MPRARAKGVSERFTEAYGPPIALERLDALLPAHDPIAALATPLNNCGPRDRLLEGGTEVHGLQGNGQYSCPRRRLGGLARRRHATAAFGLGAAPLALAGLMPRSVFRPSEDPIPALLALPWRQRRVGGKTTWKRSTGVWNTVRSVWRVAMPPRTPLRPGHCFWGSAPSAVPIWLVGSR